MRRLGWGNGCERPPGVARDERTMAKGLPLAGVRVIEFTLALAGSHAVRFWGNYGAEVIKVESRTYVDFMRNEEPRTPGVEGPNVSHRWNSSNGDKLGITLNMHHPRARELALRQDR